MSIRYVSLDEAKAHLRTGHNEDDQDILLKIQAASAAIKNYMGTFSVYEGQRNDDEDPVLDSNYEPEIQLDSAEEKNVRSEVKIAVLILIQKLYDQDYSAFSNGELPPEVTAHIYQLRDPALR